MGFCGNIYLIVQTNHKEGEMPLAYIGCTSRPVYDRIREHQRAYRNMLKQRHRGSKWPTRTPPCLVMDLGEGNWKVVQLESHFCDSMTDLVRHEALCIEKHNKCMKLANFIKVKYS